MIADVLSTQFLKCHCLCFSKVNDRTAVMVATTSMDMEITEEEAIITIMVDDPTADTVRITRGTTKGTADTTKGTADTIRDTVEDLDTSTVNLYTRRNSF